MRNHALVDALDLRKESPSHPIWLAWLLLVQLDAWWLANYNE